MDQHLQTRKNWYWAFIGVMGLAEVIAILAFWIVGRLNKWHWYQLGFEQYLGSEQFYYLMNVMDLLINAILILGAAMAFCMSRICLIAMEAEPERAKAHKNDSMAYLVLIAFILMFFIIHNLIRILRFVGVLTG